MGKKIKKIFCLLLAFLTLQLPILQLPATAEGEEEQVFEIPNASFEETDSIDSAGWSAMSAKNAEFRIDTTMAHTGKHSIYINSKDEGENPWVSSSADGLIPGCFYELSVFINSNVTSSTNRGARTKVEYYKARPMGRENVVQRADTPVSCPNGDYMLNTNDRWIEHKTIFQMPEEATVAKIYLRIYGKGEAWFDDVSLKFTGGPEKYSFDTDKVFHYKEETGGDAYVEINSFYEGKGVEEDTLADFAVYYGEELCEQAENVPAKNMQARYTYSTAYMKPYEKYTLKCKIKNKKGEVLEEHEQNLYVVDRPTMLNEDGDLMVDGKRFNPITAYHVSTEDYPKVVEAGINTVQMSYANALLKFEDIRNETLSALAAHNLKGIFCLYIDNKNAGHPDIFENTKQIVEIMKDNPNIIAYAVQDEPFLGGDDKERRIHAEEAYLAIRKIDKVHPIYICDKNREHISSKYSDIFVIDAYASGGDTRGITKTAAIAYDVTKEKNSFWELALTYNLNGSFPTMNDARNSVYRAFEEGARGMGYFSFSDANVPGAEDEQIYHWDEWDDFCKFNTVEAPILFDRFVNGNAVVFNEYDDGIGTISGWDSMRWFDWFVGDDMYLVAHNRGRETKKITIPLRSRNGKIQIDGFKAEPIGLTTQKAVSGSREMTLTLGSEEIALFKIVPDVKVDLSKINESAFDDLAGYEWAQEAITALDSKSILNAVAEGKYGPAEAITRLDFVSFLVRALGLTEEGEAFPDCDAKEIKIARKAGITNGDTEGNFRPNDTITRQDIMTTASRALNAAPTDKEIPVFSDWNLVSEYALDAVKTMVQAEVIVGNGDGTVNPLGLATRAEAAVMLYRILNTGFNKAETTVPDAPQKEVKEVITFSGTPDENALGAWLDATDLLKALGVSLPQVDSSVSHGEFETAISALIGTEYNAFAEDLKAITYAEAVEALVKLLGYEVYAPSRGGIMALAAQLELIKGLSPEEYIRSGELAVLIKNAVDIKMADRTDYGKNEEYRESEDTLLSRYRNIYQMKGMVEETYYTGADVRRGEIILDGVVYTGGEEFHRQRVVAYAEHTEDEKKILYIKPASGTEVVTVDAEDILEADTSKFRYEAENGKDELISITGAAVYVNGEKKASPLNSDLRPDLGTVTLVYTNGTVTSILVEKYENRVVQSVYKEDKTVYFKNAKELVLDKENARFYMDFETDNLAEWNVLSVLLRGDGSLYRVIRSAESVQGAPAEIADDGILLGEKVYPVAKTCFGTPTLGVPAKFYLDFSGKIAAIDDKNVTPEYGYLVRIAKDKGIIGGASLKIFTKNGEMKVFKAADSVNLNGNPTPGEALLDESLLMEGTETKAQLVVYELSGDGKIKELKTAEEKLYCTLENAPTTFSKIYFTGTEKSANAHYVGHKITSLGSKYRIASNTYTFVVPATPSENVKDYSVTAGASHYASESFFLNCSIYDWHEDYTVGAVVQTVGSSVKNVAVASPIGIFVGTGEALDEEGFPRKAIRLIISSGEEVTYFADEDLRVVLDRKTLTDVNNGETEVTGSAGSKTLKPDMPLSALNKGDIVQFELGGLDGLTLTAMRAVLRAESRKVGEAGSEGMNEFYNYTDFTVAYGPVIRTIPDGISVLAGSYERVFLHYQSGNNIAPVIIYDEKEDKMKITGLDAIRKDDMVFCCRANPYLLMYVVYR